MKRDSLIHASSPHSEWCFQCTDYRGITHITAVILSILLFRMYVEDTAFRDSHGSTGLDFNNDAVLVNIDDIAVNTTGGDNSVTDVELLDHLIVFLLPLAHRSDHEKVEHTEEQNEDNDHGQVTHEAGCACSTVGRSRRCSRYTAADGQNSY